MKMHHWFTRQSSVASALTLMVVLGSTAATAAAPKPCDLQLAVTLTPDVPDPGDDEFLSSLLSNNTGYELTLQQRTNSSVVVVELIGPGPDYRCHNVVETMRKDARVLSVDDVS